MVAALLAAAVNVAPSQEPLPLLQTSLLALETDIPRRPGSWGWGAAQARAGQEQHLETCLCSQRPCQTCCRRRSPQLPKTP